MRMEQVDMTAQKIEKIGVLFPNCITETVVENSKPKKANNFEFLQQMLSGDLLEGYEAYEITWGGKKGLSVKSCGWSSNVRVVSALTFWWFSYFKSCAFAPPLMWFCST